MNKGNCLFMRQEFERAKEMYLEAIGVEADCVEAIFNLGIVNKRMDVNNEAQQAFEKLHSIIPNNPEVHLMEGRKEGRISRISRREEGKERKGRKGKEYISRKEGWKEGRKERTDIYPY